MKNILHIVLLIVPIIIFGACSKVDNSGLSIISNQGNPQWVMIDASKQIEDDIEKDKFKFAFQNDNDHEINHFEIGDNLEISFGDIRPDSIIVYDTVLKDSGEYMYEDKLTIEVPVEELDGKYFITIEHSLVSALSSTYIENQLVYRGYRIDVKIGE